MTRSWIHFTRGRFVRQARVGLGDLREEHLSRQGFAGPVAMLYRTDGPNEVVRFEGDYRPRQVDSADVVAPDASDPRGGWQTLLSNDDVAVAISRRREAMPYCYRDMEGDLLYFVHRGRGVFATEFGPISYEPGDWVLLPKATTFRQLPEAGDSLLLVVELPQPIRLCEHEQVGRHTPIDPTMLEVPDVADYGWPKQDEYEVRVKHAGGHSSIFYRNDPMKVVGWKGDLFPFKLNVRNILPIMSDRIHVPPSSWVTFEAPGFVVLSIPRRSPWPISKRRNCRAITATSTWTRSCCPMPTKTRAVAGPAASGTRRRGSCTAPMRLIAPNFRRAASRACAGQARASASTHTGRSDPLPNSLE